MTNHGLGSGAAGSQAKRALLTAVRAPGRILWRWFTGQPMGGIPRTDAGWFTPGHKALDPATAPRPPESVTGEIRSDLRTARRQWWDLRVRRSLGREFREVEHQVVAEHQAGPEN